MPQVLDQQSIDRLADKLVAKTKAYLITMLGRTLDEASSAELYRAVAFSIREEIMINWVATMRTIYQRDERMLYYLSLEYLPGRILHSNLTNLGETEIVKAMLQKMNRSLKDILCCETDPGLGNGGLGRLASCLLDALATHHYPALAYGLRYEYGIFEQQIWNGVQIETPDPWLNHENPWEFRRDQRKASVKYCGTPQHSTNIHGDEIMSLSNYDEVFAVPFDLPVVGYNQNRDFSVVTLRLWTTRDTPHNFRIQKFNEGRLDQAAENTALTDVLYPNDNTEWGKKMRLKQEFLLVSSSLQDIISRYLRHHPNLRSFADKVRIQINDTHPALAIAELIRMLTAEHDLSWKTAVEIAQACFGYTNHTVLSEALEQWDSKLMYYLLPRQYKVIERLNQDFCTSIRSKYPNDEEKVRRMSIIEAGKVRMANLAIIGSHKVNGVAEIHSNILKNELFKDFNQYYPDKFINITNGVTQRRWLLECNPDLAEFITKRIGDKWITNFSAINELAKFAADPDTQNEFLEIKRKNKIKCIDFLSRENQLRNELGIITGLPPVIDPESLFDVQVKRVHEYKRQMMNILNLIMVYQDIINNPQSQRISRTSIIGGKAASGYETAKDIIRLIFCVARKVNKDPRVQNRLKIVYLENYNVSRAEIVIPATDLSEQISTAGLEASGTGNMKMAINGALTIGTRDGANIEMEKMIGEAFWPFAFGCSAEQIAAMKVQQSYVPREIYESNPKIKAALDALTDHTFAQTEEEHQVFSDLFHKLIEMHYGGAPDRYFNIKDLQSYYETQLKAEELFKDPFKWAYFAINNMAGMGSFSIDNTAKNYAAKVWGINPCLPDQEILDRVRYEYTIHNGR